ncbi:MAG TPA: glycosyltransferase [Novosphingobium sp.]|nr:glycosyltransferase [Novosphingobium sp.]
MGGGGAERLTVDLAAGFVDRGFEVELILLRKRGILLDLLPPQVRITGLGVDRMCSAILPLRRHLAKHRPNALLAAMWPLTNVALAAGAGLRPRLRVVISEHCMLRHQYAGQAMTLAAMRASALAMYRMADGIVGVSSGVAAEQAELAGLPANRVTAIVNPVGFPLRSAGDPDACWRGATGRRILTVGALKPQKNHLLLIDAFARVAAQRDAVLAIVGVGQEQAALEARIVALGLTGKVLLGGFTTTPGDWYAGADLFALSSNDEGFGNVLVEALHFGLPVVSTDCPTGPREILEDGRWGTLVSPSDPDALAAAITLTLDDPGSATGRRERAGEFSIQRALDAYEALLFPR